MPSWNSAFGQLEEWKDAILNAFPLEADVSRLVRKAEGRPLDLVAPGPNLPLRVTYLLQRASEENWLDELIRAAHALRPGDEHINALHSIVVVGHEPYGYFESARMGPRLLANRHSLRLLVRELAARDGPPVLLVHGERKSGKTHSGHFIRYISEREGMFRVAAVDLERLRVLQPNTRLKPTIVADNIARQLIFGVGGSGKSALVARFILDHVEGEATNQLPFAYLDFDRASLRPEDPPGLLLEIVLQLSLQCIPQRALFEAVSRDWEQRLAESIGARRSTASEIWNSFVADLATLLNGLGLSSQPFLVVLDTFEEVQYAGDGVVGVLRDCLAHLQLHLPHVRLVLAGRSLLDDQTELPIDPMELNAFDPVAAQAFLESMGVSPPAMAGVLAAQVGGSPLALKLAASLWQMDRLDVGLQDLRTFGYRENQIEGYLFRRIIQHIHDSKVRKLAYPGLVLRRITPELIKDVLAGPCGVEVSDDTEAKRVYRELARETPLVRVEGDALRHRPDVRPVAANRSSHHRLHAAWNYPGPSKTTRTANDEAGCLRRHQVRVPL